MNILLTGATGFVGRSLAARLVQQGHRVSAAVRPGSSRRALPAGCVAVPVLGLVEERGWQVKLAGIDAVVHLAARVHVLKERALDPLATFRRTNVDGTRYLVEAAALARVKRFVYVSSIKVNGEETFGYPFHADDLPGPRDAYAISKLEAERVVAQTCGSDEMDYVVVRPPLVYGASVGGNFERLIQLVNRGVPLPLASVENRRSLVSVSNLADLLACVVSHPRAVGQVFLVSDGDDWSTPGLIRSIATNLGRTARLFRFPSTALHRAASLTGKEDVFTRLCCSLEVDITDTRERLSWSPPQRAESALRETVESFVRVKSHG